MPHPPSVDGLVTVRSPHSAERTVERLEEVIRAKGLRVFASVDHAAGAREAGLEMRPADVLIFGNPRAGTPLMVASPTVALELPLKALVWADQDGVAWISYTDPWWLARRYGIPDELVPNVAGIVDLVNAAVAVD